MIIYVFLSSNHYNHIYDNQIINMTWLVFLRNKNWFDVSGCVLSNLCAMILLDKIIQLYAVFDVAQMSSIYRASNVCQEINVFRAHLGVKGSSSV